MSKHPLSGHTDSDVQLTDDLERNPGICVSRGANNEDIALVEGENTFEGDTANATTAQGGVKVDDWGRTNK